MSLRSPRRSPHVSRASQACRTALFAMLMALVVPLLDPASGTAAAQQSYRIQPGDSLLIEVIEDDSLNRTVLVAPDGWITVPLAGAVQAGGRSVPQVQSALTRELAPNFATTPNVFVSLAGRAPAQAPAPRAEPVVYDVYVIGEVKAPGLVQVEPGTSVLQLFARIGGFTRFAATGRIQLRREDAAGVERIYPLDYDAILDGRSPNGQAVVLAGDVIVVPERRLFE